MIRTPVVGIVLAVLLLASGVAAQERIAVLTEPGTPVVALDLLIGVGPMDEDATRSGVAHLAARSILAQAQPRLDSLGVRTALRVEKDALSFGLTASPDVWEDAAFILVETVLRETPDSALVLRVRRSIVDELRGRTANPADAATRELDRLFFGADHPWGRPTVGTAESVTRLTVGNVRDFLRENFTPDRVTAAVVGPIEEVEARAHLRALLGTTFPAPVEVLPYTPAGRPVRREYNAVTTWVAASYRVPETADRDALRFITFLATEALSPSPTQRSVYDATGVFEPRVGGGEIRLQVVVPPEEAPHWVDRIEEAVTDLASLDLMNVEFDGHLRRYRGDRLMRFVSPEERAHEFARQLYVDGRVTGIASEAGGLTQERVRAAARALGPPTILLLGPTLD
jgi:predicted Zn-dependent peptidase